MMFKDLLPSLGFCPFHALLWVLKGFFIFRFIKFFEIFVRSIWGHFFTRPKNLEPYKQSWTVITGCTDGIGRAYLEELVATKGIRKLFLIARNSTKLESLSSYLKETYERCEIKTAIFDFEKDDFEQMPYELESLEVGILINCAGTAPDRVANFANLPIGLSSAILRVNLLSCVKMIELILPGMLKRDRGIIVNFSSITVPSIPSLAVLHPFFRVGVLCLICPLTLPAKPRSVSSPIRWVMSLLIQTSKFRSNSPPPHNVLQQIAIAKASIFPICLLQCLLPLLVATKLTQYASEDANLFVLDTKSYARQAVNIIGNYRISTGCFVHDMQIAFGSLIGFNLFKLFYVPFGILGIHKKRFDAYRKRMIETEEAKSGGIKSE